MLRALGALIAFVWLIPVHAQGFLSSHTITIEPSYSVSPISNWNILEKINEGDDSLLAMPLAVGTKSYPFTERRISVSNTATKTFKEPDREIALKLLNTQTGGLEYIKIKFHAGEITSPNGWHVEMLERPNGIRWNYWNTAYTVTQPSGYVVIKNNFPNIIKDAVIKKVKDKKGRIIEVVTKPAEVEYIVYSPYSPDLHKPELIKAGEEYLNQIAEAAINDLRQKNVMSRSFSGSSVAAVPQLPVSFFARLPLLEQTDYGEFVLDPENTVDRVLVLLGTNKQAAYNATCSGQAACGLYQFTKPTYNSLVKTYPQAELIPDFKAGSRDHVNSAKAAVLLYDYNLVGLINSYGSQVLSDPRLEEYLAASYNGKPARVTNSLKAFLKAGISDWVNALLPIKGGLATETKGYMVKLRWLQEHKIL
ncbi:hypothetical protein KW791_04170 [Candidatus Parcubacteria bacterium]|nr:hypothetical protein [Candidatus Parcubacteria bacterium]